MQRLIICPNDLKMKILNEFAKEKELMNIKFMTKNEYLNKYYFNYDERALYYLMDKYNLNIDVAKVYLNNLYIIDEKKDYKEDKLKFLKEIKLELINNKLLEYSPSFKKYLEGFNIEVKGYYDLDLYEEKALNYKFEYQDSKITVPVYEYKTLEEEVNGVCIKIIELLNNGIDINKIYLCNVSEDYLYTIKKLFNYYKIPITLNLRNSIYSSKIVNNYLTNNELNLEDTSITNKKLVSVINSLTCLDKDNDTYKKILIDKLKNTYYPATKYDRAIEIKDLYSTEFNEDEYVFVLGFNQDSLPRVRKDIDYIQDSIKKEVDMYSTGYLNNREKEIATYFLSRIPNLYLSYKLNSAFNEYFPSSLIKELNLEVIKDNSDDYRYSNFYNKVRLTEMLDNYNLYNEKDDLLDVLNSHYKIPYNTYNNQFTGINNDLYIRSIIRPLRMSYTALNSYNECAFKYYLKYVLKVDSFEDSFEAYIGSMYHKILSLYKKTSFDFEGEYNKYLEKRDLTLKEKLLLVRIKKELLEFINVLKEQEDYTTYHDELYEQEAKVNINKKVSIEFVGYIDKIMYRKNIEDTYFSIVDYKSGTIDTHIEPMKYGLHMQLPVYLYLIHYGHVFTNPIFTGIYYQNILFKYPTWSNKLEQEQKSKYYLNGYSTTELDILESFDRTYKDSEYIKSMKYTPDKGFGTYSKVIDNDTLLNLVKYTKNEIENKLDDILDGYFPVNPKVYNKKNISCEYCKYKDICYMKDTDLINYPKVDNLSFLGGDE
ncbi:MAG: PD-(D/E)XK nuclease family protein [Bacilli bacterium]|nr:PD-(D/E)XK nuclease family protein [Bacilli bacterium]